MGDSSVKETDEQWNARRAVFEKRMVWELAPPRRRFTRAKRKRLKRIPCPHNNVDSRIPHACLDCGLRGVLGPSQRNRFVEILKDKRNLIPL